MTRRHDPGPSGGGPPRRASLPGVQPDAPTADDSALPSTIDAAVALAIDGLLGLAELGEDVDDEWQYVQDLAAAWRDRLEAVVETRGAEALAADRAAAVVRAVDEASLITDPHRAIDWLSTLPQVVLVALGERP